jgi:hypothetical protein
MLCEIAGGNSRPLRVSLRAQNSSSCGFLQITASFFRIKLGDIKALTVC